MLKHVQISPMRNRSDSISLRSATSCASSLCGSPEPPSDHTRTPSRASSYSSLNEAIPQTTIKIYTACLRIDIEYKTLGIQWSTTSREVIGQLLRRCKMRHRDPRLFFLSMEVIVRRAGVRTVLVLDNEAQPAILQACHPKGESRFCLQVKAGGLIRVHTSVLQPTSQYKSLVISEETTSDELLSLLLSTYNSNEPVEQFSLYEVCPGQEYQRKLHPDDLPLRAQTQRTQRGETCHFLVRRNPNYPRRKQILPPIVEARNTSVHSINSIRSGRSDGTQDDEDDDDDHPPCRIPMSHSSDSIMCRMCKNTFKSCDFCNTKNMSRTYQPALASSEAPQDVTKSVTSVTSGNKKMHSSTTAMQAMSQVAPTYNPVYNIREIRTVCNSFSSLGIDKKLLDVETVQSYTNAGNRTKAAAVGAKAAAAAVMTKNIVVQEVVNNNPAKGFGHFVYI